MASLWTWLFRRGFTQRPRSHPDQGAWPPRKVLLDLRRVRTESAGAGRKKAEVKVRKDHFSPTNGPASAWRWRHWSQIWLIVFSLKVKLSTYLLSGAAILRYFRLMEPNYNYLTPKFASGSIMVLWPLPPYFVLECHSPTFFPHILLIASPNKELSSIRLQHNFKDYFKLW